MMIGLCLSGSPVLGVVHAPAHETPRTHYAVVGQGAFVLPGDACGEGLGGSERIRQVPISCSLFLLLARGCRRVAFFGHFERETEAWLFFMVSLQTVINCSLTFDPFRTAVPCWGQTTWNLSGLSPKRDCGYIGLYPPDNPNHGYCVRLHFFVPIL